MGVVRGGSWNNNAKNLRVSNRNQNNATNRNNNIGFRCARDGRDSKGARIFAAGVQPRISAEGCRGRPGLSPGPAREPGRIG
jgi:hypothetical protein